MLVVLGRRWEWKGGSGTPCHGTWQLNQLCQQSSTGGLREENRLWDGDCQSATSDRVIMAATCPGLQQAERPHGSSRQHLCSTVRSPHQNKPAGLDCYWGWRQRAPEEAADRETLFKTLFTTILLILYYSQNRYKQWTFLWATAMLKLFTLWG